jgi:hypothetical protein
MRIRARAPQLSAVLGRPSSAAVPDRETRAVNCPRCRLVNPPTAERCDCGYDFAAGLMKEPYIRPKYGDSSHERPSRAARSVSLLDTIKEEQRRIKAGEPPLSPPRRPPSFAEVTGQAGRLRLAQAIVLSGGLVLVAGWWQRLGVRLTLIGTAIGAVGFVFQCLAVRCPKCRVAVVWHTFCNRKMSEAQMAAMFQVACPNCGFHPDASTERVRREGVVQRADGADEPRP